MERWRCQWWEWFQRGWNWRNFTVVRCDVEAAPAWGPQGRYVEVTAGLMGFVWTIEVYDEVDREAALSPIMRRLQDWRERNHEERE